MAERAKHAHGSSENLTQAIENQKVDAFDVLFLDANTDNPKIGWLDSQGNPVIIDHKADMAKMETALGEEIATKANASELTELSEEVATKVDAATVETMIKEYSDSIIEVVEF